MKNFTTIVDVFKEEVHEVEEGFDSSLVVEVNYGVDSDDWQAIRKSIVCLSYVKQAYIAYKKGVSFPLMDASWVLHASYYWLVRRENGSLYPFPLLFASHEERVESARRKNNEEWDLFYKGYSSEPKSVDCPSEQEINYLLGQIEQLTGADESPWDYLDQRGGLVPRWAA